MAFFFSITMLVFIFLSGLEVLKLAYMFENKKGRFSKSLFNLSAAIRFVLAMEVFECIAVLRV